ncbi:MAG: DUF4115 domain-containing protein [Leptolyngbyaceae cyanobacterium MO_188.B28]|nr:DUF4115 domain-containing protein [Leptolyngbyaceae cyanobacterium MO_188.B28]
MANLNFSQKEQLKEIGAYLRQTRQNQGLSVDQIATAIYVRPTLLKAIEEGEAKPLPEPVFIQGFIRRYGDALGIDGITLSKKFLIDSGLGFSTAETPEPREVAKSAPSLKPAITVDDIRDFIKNAPKTPSLQKIRESSLAYLSSAYVSYAAVGIVAIFGLIMLANLINRPKPASEPAEVDNPVTAEASSTTPAALGADSLTGGASELTNASSQLGSPITIAINLTGNCWMRVIVDGKTQFEGTLTKGAEKTWTAQQEIKIRAGNAGAVLLSLNGASARPAGDIDTVKDLTFTPTSTPEEIFL